jgi:hypothetical protein
MPSREAPKRAAKPQEGPIRAQVVLKSAGGKSLLDADTISADNIREFAASPETVASIKESLAELGFTVLRASPLQVTVEAPRDQFEKVFQGEIAPLGGGKERGSASKQTKGAASYWEWSAPPKVPVALKDAVDEVVFPRPTKPLR